MTAFLPVRSSVNLICVRELAALRTGVPDLDGQGVLTQVPTLGGTMPNYECGVHTALSA